MLRLAAVLMAAPIPARLVAAGIGQADDLEKEQAVRRAGIGLEQAASLSLAPKPRPIRPAAGLSSVCAF